MAEITNTLDQELAELGVVGSYLWKPNRFYARDGDVYRSVDVISDGNAEEIAAAVAQAGEEQIAAIQSFGQSQITELTALARNYDNYKSNLIQTYSRLERYYESHGMVALSTIMKTAIVNLNNL